MQEKRCQPSNLIMAERKDLLLCFLGAGTRCRIFVSILYQITEIYRDFTQTYSCTLPWKLASRLIGDITALGIKRTGLHFWFLMCHTLQVNHCSFCLFLLPLSIPLSYLEYKLSKAGTVSYYVFAHWVLTSFGAFRHHYATANNT